MKVAIIHDWLTVYGGAERVLGALLRIYPEAELYAIVDFLPDEHRQELKGRPVHTSFIQSLPGARHHYRNYLPLMPIAVEQWDLSGFDLVISSSYAVAKGVITGPDQLHVCYCHSPIRYAWDLQHQYLAESGLTHGVKSVLVRWLLHRIRIWDYRTAHGVDHFVANSEFIRGRIRKVYGRDAEVIYPNVAVNEFGLCAGKEDFFLTASRLVPYKRVALIAEAFAHMPDRRLVVIGDGPEMARLRAVAKGCENISVLGYQSSSVLRSHMERARAFIFAGEEDFGITLVEAQACGTPVIAYGKGGAMETVVEGGSGMFFHEQTLEAIQEAVSEFPHVELWPPHKIRAHALTFSEERFRHKFLAAIDAQAGSMSDAGTLRMLPDGAAFGRAVIKPLHLV